MTLQPPDSFHLNAAVGWLELGDHLSASEELEKITPDLRMHPDVLELQCEIHRRNKDWPASLETARSLLECAPDRESGWVLGAQAHYYMKRYQEAFDTLAPALTRFPKSAVVIYDLACYHCLLGRADQAHELVSRAIKLGGDSFKDLALADPDLEPLWPKLRDAPEQPH